MTEDSLLPFDLPAVQRKKVTADFAGGSISSDGGLVLLRAAERRLGLAEALADCIREWRDPDRVVHTLPAMLRFRMFAIACGYEDADDCDALRGDPLFKLAVGRAPEMRLPLRRASALGASARTGTMSPSARALKRSTTYRSSASPPPKKWTRKVFAVLPGIAIAVDMVPPPSCRWWETAGTPSPGRRPAAPASGHTPLSAAQRVSAATSTRDAERSARAQGGRQSPGGLANLALLRCNRPSGTTPCGRAPRRAGGWTKRWRNLEASPAGGVADRERAPQTPGGRCRTCFPPIWPGRFAISTTRNWTGCGTRSLPRAAVAGVRTARRLDGGTGRRPAPVTPGQERLVLAAFESGLKPAAIAREFRLSRAQVVSVVAAAKPSRR